MNKIIISALITLNLLFLAGCAATSQDNQQPKKETSEILASERLITKLEANRKKIKNLYGRGTISVKTPDFNNSAFFEVNVKKPDTVYIQILGPFGIDLAKILIAKDKFQFYDVLRNTLYKGNADSDVLKQMFKVDIKLSEIMDALTGAVNMDNRLYKTPDQYEIKGNKYELGYLDTAAGKQSHYSVSIADLGITDYILSDLKNQVLFQCKYQDFILHEGVAIPYKITLDNKKLNQGMTIEYNKVVANEKDPKINFSVPDDVSVINY